MITLYYIIALLFYAVIVVFFHCIQCMSCVSFSRLHQCTVHLINNFNQPLMAFSFSCFLCLRQQFVHVRASIRACASIVRTLLARCLTYLLREFYQTFTTNGLWGKDERVKFWGLKVNGQGHGGVKYVPECTFCLVVFTCWWRHNSRRSRNHHLVLLLSQLNSLLCQYH